MVMAPPRDPPQPAAAAAAPAHLACSPRPTWPRPGRRSFDVTGLWLHGGGQKTASATVRRGFKLTPAAPCTSTPRARRRRKASPIATTSASAGRPACRDHDPRLAIAMVQLPTVIFMTSEFMNSLRIVYLDGRGHSEADVVVPTTTASRSGAGRRHAGRRHEVLPRSSPLARVGHPNQRRRAHGRADRKLDNGQTLEIELTATDPKSWVGEWKWVKRWRRVDDRDIAEVTCYPDLNDPCRARSQYRRRQ